MDVLYLPSTQEERKIAPSPLSVLEGLTKRRSEENAAWDAWFTNRYVRALPRVITKRIFGRVPGGEK